jgi:5'-nucleotidase
MQNPNTVRDQRIALFDMDGTLADYEAALLRDLERMRSPYEPPLQLSPDHDEVSWIAARIQAIKRTPGWWENLPRLHSGFQLLALCQEIGFQIHILTKGPRTSHNAWTEKLLWCQQHIDPGVNVTITFDKSLVYGRVLVDDYPPYVDAWLAHRPRGIAVMPETQYNRDYRHERAVRFAPLVNKHEVRFALQAAFDRETQVESALAPNSDL